MAKYCVEIFGDLLLSKPLDSHAVNKMILCLRIGGMERCGDCVFLGGGEGGRAQERDMEK